MRKARNRRGAAATQSPPAPATPDGVPFCAGWIWWSASPTAERKPPKSDFDKQIPADIRKEFHDLMRKYRDNVEQLTHGVHFKNIGDGIWELRIKRHGNPYRLLFMRWGKWAVALDVFHKTTQATPKATAMQRKAAWLDTRGDKPPL